MRVEPVPKSTVTFGYKHPVKTYYLKGKIPLVKDFYGGDLRPDTATIEHLLPVSKGGKTTTSNVVISNRHNNELRSNFPLKDFINFEAMEEYLAVFEKIDLPGLNGKAYADAIRRTVHKLIGENR